MEKKYKIRRAVLTIVIVLALYSVPTFLKKAYPLRVCTYVCIYSILACSLNLISGVCGQVSMGHAAFFGIGAYTSALFSINLGLPWPICLLVAFVFSGIAGIIIGTPALRLKGGYLVICTVGFNELVRLILLNWVSLTRGPMGITNIPRPTLFGYTIKSGKAYLYLALTLFLIVYVLLKRIVNSKIGRNLRAIKEDEIAASVMGIPVHREKIIAFATASAFAGVAGSMLAHYMVFISPNLFIGDNSTTYLSMVVLGGMGNLAGSAIAAFILTVLPELLRGLNNYRMLIYGLLLIILMLSKTKDWSDTFVGRNVNKIKLKVLSFFGTEKGGSQL